MTPSTETTKGVNDTHFFQYVFFFYSAEHSIASHLSLWLPRMLKSAIKAGLPLISSASYSMGSLTNLLYTIAAESPRASRTSLWRWVTSPAAEHVLS